MKVTAAVKQQVTATIKAGIVLLNEHYKIDMKMPTVVYKKRGRVAGTADSGTWEIDLNSVLLMENVDHFMASTVPHELAHLGTYKVYPETMKRTYRGQKRSPHGPRWQEVMRVLGVKDVTRCHKYDVSNSKVNRKPRKAGVRIDYKCSVCSTVIPVTAHMHRNITSGRTYRHNGCRGSKVVLAMQPTPVVKAPVVKATPASRSLRTKASRAWRLYQNSTDSTRSVIVALFMKELDMTKAGASTYEYKCRKRLETEYA